MCVHNNWPYDRLDTESSGGMSPAYTQAPPPSFETQRIVNSIAADGVVITGHVEELDRWSKEERRVWERRVQDLEEEVRRLRCKVEEDKGCHKDGSRIYPRGDVFINRVEGVEEGVASIDPYSTPISKGGE